MASTILIENAGKTYGTATALRDVSFRVPEGKCLALIGHNGAGKTSLMKLMLGLTRATSGRVEVLGENPATAGKHFRCQIGFLPENVIFYDELTGRQMLEFCARLKGLPTTCCSELLDRVGMSDASGRRLKTYSKGMRQRLGLAQALLGSPRLLLLDEPTVGLDPVLRHEFFQIVRQLTATGTTVVLSSHILTELEAQTNLVAILRRGNLVAFGDLEQLRREANLQTRIRVRGDADKIAARLNGSFAKSIAADRSSIEISCPLDAKMALLRTLGDLEGACSDLEIRPPSLDDLYLHFSGEPNGASKEIDG